MKLYWRLKKSGRWTWKAVTVLEMAECPTHYILNIKREEEE